MSIKNSPEMPQTELNYELFFCSIFKPPKFISTNKKKLRINAEYS